MADLSAGRASMPPRIAAVVPERDGLLAATGTGVQARAHLRAVPRVRSFREVRVAGHDAAKARALVDDARSWLGGITLRAAASYAEAIAGADVVSAATHSPEPVVRREW